MAPDRATASPAKGLAPTIEKDAKKAKINSVTEQIRQLLETEIEGLSDGHRNRKLHAWINAPPAPVPDDKSFEGHKSLTFNTSNYTSMFVKPASKKDWKDKELTNLKCYRLSHLKDDDIITIGKSFMSSLHIEMKKNVIEEMFLLAFNLRDRLSERIIDKVELSLVSSEYPHVHDEQEMYSTALRAFDGGRLPVTSIGDTASADQKRRLAIAYSYLAASYIRLFTKPAENYLRIGNNLETQFEKFYSFKIPLRGFHPNLYAFLRLKILLEDNVRARDSLYVFLYSANRCTKGKNIKDFLYGDHIIYKGLHPFTLFLKAMEMHDKSSVEIAKALDNPKLHKNLKQILSVIKRFILSESPEYTLEMWKYARLFDESFMSDLCTKRCMYLTLVLAFLTRASNTSPDHDVFNITQLKKAPLLLKNLAREHALKAVKQLLSQKITPDSSPNQDVFDTAQVKKAPQLLKNSAREHALKTVKLLSQKTPDGSPNRGVFNIPELKDVPQSLKDSARKHALKALKKLLSQKITSDHTEGCSQF